MKKTAIVVGAILMTFILAGCTGQKRYHKMPLDDPSGYKAHFPDMDGSGDELVTWEEFKAHFPDTNTDVFHALDLNKDGNVDHDEWHEFKEAHGLKEH